MNDVNKIFENEAFDCLDENMKNSVKSLYISLKGKTTQEALPYVISFLKQMPKDIKLTREQKNAIFAVLTSSMSEGERKSLLMMLNMFGF